VTASHPENIARGEMRLDFCRSTINRRLACQAGFTNSEHHPASAVLVNEKTEKRML
jgi:hypothetical protein